MIRNWLLCLVRVYGLQSRPHAPAFQFYSFWESIGLIMILTVCVGSLMPHMPELSVEVPDKLVHLLAYGSLTYWWGMLYPRTAPRWVFSGLFIVLGVTLEFAQRTTGYRTFDILDMVANAGGVLLGRLAVETPLAGLLAALDRLMVRLRAQVG